MPNSEDVFSTTHSWCLSNRRCVRIVGTEWEVALRQFLSAVRVLELRAAGQCIPNNEGTE
jgi:predicted acyltransferase